MWEEIAPPAQFLTEGEEEGIFKKQRDSEKGQPFHGKAEDLCGHEKGARLVPKSTP